MLSKNRNHQRSDIIDEIAIRQEQGEELGAAPRFARPLSSARVFEGGVFPRSLLEQYSAQVPGATLTHAVLAIIGEATRRYLESHDERGEEQLQALLQLNIRNAGAHALVGNRIAINQIELHDQVSFPIGRLQAICATHPELHSVEDAELTNFRLRSLYENLPAPMLAWLGRNAHKQNSLGHRIMEGGNLGLAELPGPGKPLYLLGAKLLGFSGISPLYSGCGLMFNSSIYCDQVGITFASDRSMMPDPEHMRQCLEAAVKDLGRFLNPDSPARSTKKSPSRQKRRRKEAS